MKSPYPLYRSSNPLFSDSDQLDVFKGKPFWCGRDTTPGSLENSTVENNKVVTSGNPNCCFNHIVGLPEKDGKPYPIFDYQQSIFDAIENNSNIWVLKSRGIGLTTYLIRYLSWKILSSSELDHQNIFIISGTREAHANYIKERMAALFERNFPQINLESKYTELWLKNTWVKVFPSLAIKDLRGYFSAAYIWCDESDYLNDSVQDELIHAIHPYQAKGNCKIILSSTPYKPNGLMQRIELDKNSKYFKLRLPYQLGLNKIYSINDIEQQRNSVEFKREFELQYLGRVGNFLTQQQVDLCTKLGNEYTVEEIPVSNYSTKYCGVDFGFSSSGTGIVCLEHMRNQLKEGKIKEDVVRVIDCHLIEKGDPNQIVDICWSIWRKYGFMNVFYFCDAANAGMINLMKVRWDENTQWQKVEDVHPHNSHILPVSFGNNQGKQMLANLHLIISKGYLAINPKYDKLITSLRTAYCEELSLDKEQTSYDDLLDSLRLATKSFHFN